MRLMSKSEETVATSSSSSSSLDSKRSHKPSSKPIIIRSRSSKFEQQLTTKLRNSRKTAPKRAGKRPGKREKRETPYKRSTGEKRRSNTVKRSCPISSDIINHFHLKCQHCGRETCGKLEFLPTKATKTKARITQKKQKAKGAVTGAACDDQASPLCIRTAAPEQLQSAEVCWCEITPHMLHHALSTLLKWRQSVDLETLANFIAKNYPVNPDPTELRIELIEKLRVATLCENVVQVSANAWNLPDGLLNERLTSNHVTRFWTIYADSMNPIRNPAETNPRPLRSNAETQTREMPDYIS